jgi:hypothetical protein
MDADILFHNPDDVNPGIAELVQHGFTVEVLDLVDPEGPTVFVRARTVTELDMSTFFDWAQSIIEPLQGWLHEAGPSDPPSPPFA